MAAKKTSMFTLTERITVSAATTDTFATIDLGSYVDVGDRQALQIHSVDYIVQGSDVNATIAASLGAGELQAQLTDLNRGGLVFANDRSLVSSMRLILDTDAYLTNVVDMYPDNYGKGADDGRFVVNDTLFITARASALAGSAVNVVVRVNASIVTLSNKDFMAIAIQSTAADN